jgi:hypothetical protein
VINSSQAVLRMCVFALILVFAAAACGGADDDAATTVDASEDVVFGSGPLPDSVPDDFPVPEEARISSTLVVRSAGTTEVIMRMPATVEAAVEYFEENLDARGFERIVSEADAGGGWVMEIARDDLVGTLDFSPVGESVAEVVIRFEMT